MMRLAQASRGVARLSNVLRQMSTAANAASEEVLAVRNGFSHTIVLNRPKALNALNLNMVRLINKEAKIAEEDPKVNVLMMKGSGEKAFCAGGDVVSICKSGRDKVDGGALSRDFFFEEYQTDYFLGTMKTPYVALIDGITMGGGVGVSILAPFRVATEKTVFAMPETGIGLFPDVGGSYFLPRLPGSTGMYLALTGHRLQGADTCHAGIATHFVPSARIPELQEALSRVGEASQDSVRKVLDSFDELPSGMSAMSAHVHVIDTAFSADSVAEIIRRLEKNNTEWAQAHVKKLRKMSPLSLAVTFEQIRRGKTLSLKDCFKMEYRLSQHFMAGTDFYEGVDALLIRKDNAPKWQHKSVEDVTAAEVAQYFEPVGRELLL